MNSLKGRNLVAGLFMICAFGYRAFSQHEDLTDKVFQMGRVEWSARPEGGTMIWKNNQWVPSGDAKVTGIINIFLKSGPNEALAGTFEITGSVEKAGVTYYFCENGESFYVIGSPDGSFPMSAKSLVDPGSVAPVIKSASEKTEDMSWRIWKSRFTESLQRLLGILESGNAEQRKLAADRLGYIYHPKVEAALRKALKDRDNEVKQAAKHALQKTTAVSKASQK